VGDVVGLYLDPPAHSLMLSAVGRREVACVDGPRLAREEIELRQTGCLRSCVRPTRAAIMAAGPDGCSRAGTSSNPRV
jgi:hypothetical protein